MFRVLYSGSYFGSQRPRTWIESWEVNWKPKKYHEVVNSAFMDAIVRPFSGKRTPKSCMLTSVARVLQRTAHTKRGELIKRWKNGGWERTLHPRLLMEMMMRNRAVMNDLGHRKPLLTQEQCARCPCRLHALAKKEENDPVLRNNCCCEKSHDGQKMTSGKVKSGMPQRKKDGSNLHVAVDDKGL